MVGRDFKLKFKHNVGLNFKTNIDTVSVPRRRLPSATSSRPAIVRRLQMPARPRWR